MKEQKKLKILNCVREKQEICRCYFIWNHDYYYNYYVHTVNETFMLGQLENDFQLDGYGIHKIAHLKKVEKKEDKCSEINRLFGIADQIQKPEVDLTSWEAIFCSLQNMDGFVMIEDDKYNRITIGSIQKVMKKKLLLKAFDADGKWMEELCEIPYEFITGVRWNCRYTNYWYQYMKLNG